MANKTKKQLEDDLVAAQVIIRDGCRINKRLLDLRLSAEYERDDAVKTEGVALDDLIEKIRETRILKENLYAISNSISAKDDKITNLENTIKKYQDRCWMLTGLGASMAMGIRAFMDFLQ